MNKTILITGSEGFIGKNVVEFFLTKKFRVIGIDKKEKTNPNKNLIFFNKDLKDIFSIKNKLDNYKIDILVHLAAMPGIIECNNKPTKAFNENIRNTFNIFHLTETLGVKKIFYFSSLSTYNFLENPHLYALSKKFSQDIAHTQKIIFKKKSCCINLSNVYGDYSEKKKSFVNLMIRNEIENKTLRVFYHGLQKRDFIYVKDIPKVLFKLINRRNLQSSYNLCTSKLISLKNVIKIYQKICRNKLKFKLLKSQKNYNEPKNIKNKKNDKSVKLTQLKDGLTKTREYYLRRKKT